MSSEAKVKEAVAAVATALVGLDSKDAYAALDRASVILPRRAFLVGDHHGHDGDPNDEMARYIVDVIGAMRITDEPDASLLILVKDALKKVRPPWV